MPPYVYLIGQSVNGFEDKLPRQIDVLRFYYHFQNVDESEKIRDISNQVQQIYHRARIETIHFESIRSKVKRLIATIKPIIATRKSLCPSQIEKESLIFQKIFELFEVSKNEDLLPILMKNFLFDQRTTRDEFVSNIAVQIPRSSSSNVPSTSNQTTNLLYFTHNLQSMTNQIDAHNDTLDYEYDSDEVDFDTSTDFMPIDTERGRKKFKLCDNDIKELSQCGGSYRVIEKALTIGIKAAGGDPRDYAISKTSLCGQSNKFRTIKKSANLEQIAGNNEKALILFDGKKFAKINQRHIGKDSRMVAICHTREKDIALGLPILDSGHARVYANEIFTLCENSNLTNRVIGLVCDTTNVNLGASGGVCALFEKDVKRNVLNIACRHHIYELLLSSALKAALGTFDAPTLTIFHALKEMWSDIKERGFQYSPCDEIEFDSPNLQDLYINAKETLIGHAKSTNIRDDYAELTDLCLKFLGVRTQKSFMVPGSDSRARWLSKAIYGIKMYLFRENLNLEPSFERNLLHFAIFVSVIYCKYWNRSTNVFDAPVNDLSLIADLQKYSDENENIANSVLNTLWNHLWYLGEELAPLALFSERVGFQDKNRMRVKLISNACPPRGPNSLKLKNFADGTELTDLVTKRSQFLFSILDLNSSFLEHEAETWKSQSGYKKAKRVIAELLVVVNDKAERALGKATTIINNQKARTERNFQNMFASLYS